MKICVLGNGLSALILTKILTSKGIYVDLYISNHKTNRFVSRTIGITEENILFLQQYYPLIKKYGNPIKDIKIYKDQNISQEILRFHSKDKIQFYVFKYYKFLDLIKKKVYENKYVKIKNILKINNKNFFKNNLIIDTDLNNKFSLKYFNKKIQKNYFSKAYTTILSHKKIANNTAIQVFTEIGPLAFLPINETSTSVVFSIKNPENVKNINELIRKYNNKYFIKKLSSLENFDLKFSVLRKYNHLNVLAFGEKLHNIHPLAGQGFNMCIRDIKNLINIIDKNIELGLSIDHSTFSTFEKNTKHYNLVFATGIDLIHELFFLEKKIPNNITNKIFKVLNQTKFFKKFSFNIANKGV